MGLFEAIFQRPKQNQEYKTFKTLTGYTPTWRAWGGNIYENNLVRNAIDTRARHISKLKVSINGNPQIVNALKHRPNDWQTWGQFLYRLSTIVDVKNTAFIVPIIDRYGDTKGVYSIVPTEFQLIEHNGEPFLRFRFESGEWAAMELSKVGIMTKYQYKSDFFGENNDALNATMELINIQNQGINEAVKNSATYRFMATLTNFTNDEDLKKERQAFTRDNLESGSGLLLFPHTYKDIKQIESTPYIPDADQMKIIRQNVFDYYGVNEDVIQNKAIGEKWSAFYEGAIEPFAIQFSDVMTKMLFSKLEQSYGSGVYATANRLQYATVSEKLQVSTQLGDRGILNRDSIREIWNLEPLPNGEGQDYFIRGEYKNATNQIVKNTTESEEGDDEQ